MGKVIKEETVTIVDENGSLKKEINHNVAVLPTEPPYVKMYLNDLGNILGLKNRTKQVLSLLVKKLDYEGMITLVASSKDRIAAQINTTRQVVDNSIRDLTKKQILKRISNGEFEMNPNYFARGDWKTISRRREDFKVEITYSIDGERRIKACD